jgi:hypothetical protein
MVKFFGRKWLSRRISFSGTVRQLYCVLDDRSSMPHNHNSVLLERKNVCMYHTYSVIFLVSLHHSVGIDHVEGFVTPRCVECCPGSICDDLWMNVFIPITKKNRLAQTHGRFLNQRKYSLNLCEYICDINAWERVFSHIFFDYHVSTVCISLVLLQQSTTREIVAACV